MPAADVERAAHLYGAGPSLLWIGQGLQRQPNGGNVVRSVAALPAVTGNLGRPGGGFLYLNGFANRGIDEDDLSGARAFPDVPEPLSHMDLAAHLEDPERSRAFVCWNVNPAASCPEQGRLRRALQREDLFTVVADVFATDTVDLADVVLPAASWLECDDVVVPYFHRALSAQVKAAEPPGEALPNSEIFRRLAAAARAVGRAAPRTRRADHRTDAGEHGHRPGLRGARRARNGVDVRRSAPRAVRRPALSDAERTHRARLAGGRRGRPRPSAAADGRRAPRGGTATAAVAGLALVAERELRQRRAAAAALGRAEREPERGRRGGPRAVRGRARPR